jgi:hypothetical protein
VEGKGGLMKMRRDRQAISVDDNFFVDHTSPFGLATTRRIRGHVADATVDILQSLDLGLFKKWVDDHINFRFPLGGGETLPDGSSAPFHYMQSSGRLHALSHCLRALAPYKMA